MKLLRVHIISAPTCGGLLDGLDLWLRNPTCEYKNFDPLCLIGPNGAGKSQFLQVLTEIFQALLHACVGTEEREDSNPELLFEIEYLIRANKFERNPAHVRVSRKAVGSRKTLLSVERYIKGEWQKCDLSSSMAKKLLPSKVIGYSSGDNETLSLPFFVSRGAYAQDVASIALSGSSDYSVPDTRLMLIDYGTHLEVLVANLLMGNKHQREALLEDARLEEFHSFRCVVQLAHPVVPRAPKSIGKTSRKGIQLTNELEMYLDSLKSCSTCYEYIEKTETYIFDFWVNSETRKAVSTFWRTAFDLYSAFHKLAMLNDLAIAKPTRERFRRETKARRFASRLPEPQDEDKVFRFERVNFLSRKRRAVDYVSLSDGEHQLAQILGTLCMLSSPKIVFLLDEPESHFNPHWRVKFISRVLDLPTPHGARRGMQKSSEQECIMTTHSPFVPSDMSRDNIFIFSKDSNGKISVRKPDIETYGTTFDTILEECFEVRPPISKVSFDEIQHLKKSNSPEKLKEGMDRLGYSVEKVFLADRLRQISKKRKPTAKITRKAKRKKRVSSK